MSSLTELALEYKGPKELAADVDKALGSMTRELRITHTEHETHSLVLISNFCQPKCLRATAVYLVAAIAQSIDANLRIRSALFDEVDITRDLSADVSKVLREADAEAEYKTMVRNPWLWEGISHMLVHLSRRSPLYHPSGPILAKTSIKYDVHDHGLDMIAIYGEENLGLTAGECKAYLADPAGGIRDASKKLGEVDSNVRDIEMRAAVNQLRTALPEAAMSALAGSFWRNERSYLPFVCCDASHAVNWNRGRKSLRLLAVPVARKLLMPLVLDDALKTFDAICTYMRAYASM